MTTLTIPVEKIDAEARKLDPAKAIATVVMLIPFLIGWFLGKVWLVLTWMWAAGLVGWREARAPRPTRDRADA